MICWKCMFLFLLFRFVRTNKDYWRFTNLFIALHGGKDYCNLIEKVEAENAKECAERKQLAERLDSFKGLRWGMRFYHGMGFRITDDEDDENALTETMDGILEQLKASMGLQEKKLTEKEDYSKYFGS